MKTKDLVICSLFAAITAVIAQISIPFPGGVPLTMQTLIISLGGVILGAKRGLISIGIYILLGAIGLPVFASFSGGVQVIFGPTGGFIISFPLMVYVIGIISQKTDNKALIMLSMILGSVINYIFGMVHFSLITKMTMKESFFICVMPFIVTGLVKSIVAAMIGIRLKKNILLKEVLEK